MMQSNTTQQAFTARVEPTIFYRETRAGMVEVVDVFIGASSFRRPS